MEWDQITRRWAEMAHRLRCDQPPAQAKTHDLLHTTGHPTAPRNRPAPGITPRVATGDGPDVPTTR